MLNAEQEDSYLEQCMQDYFDKKYKKKNKNIPDKIIIWSVNDLT